MKRIIGLLGWIGVALVVAAVVLLITRPDLEQWRRGLALSGLAATALYALTQWRDIARAFGGRGAKYGSMAAAGVLLVLAILVAVNWIASRQNRRWDLTADSQFSLAEQTQQILRGLDRPVTFRVFYTVSDAEYRDRLAEYAYHSGQVSTVYVDAEANPLEAQKFAIESVPTILVEYDGRTERVNAIDEQTLTNALKRVVEGAAKKIYFLQGHGEADPMATDPGGYSTVVAALRNDNFDVAPLTLAQQSAIPADATVVVIAGPRTDLLPGEIDALRAYLRGGGKLQLLIDPPQKGAGSDVPNLVALARDWGIEVGNNVIIDASGLGQILGTDPSVPVAMPVQHPITNNFRVMTAFPLARSVTPIEGGTGGHVAQRVLESSPDSWGETDVTALFATGRPTRDEGADAPGPVSLAVAVSAAAETPAPPAPAGEAAAADADTDDAATADAPKPETRLVVVGDSDFATNRIVGLQGNREIFLNMASWLAQQEDLIAIRPSDPASRPFTMTEGQAVWIYRFAIFIVPALLFANAIRLWRKRR